MKGARPEQAALTRDNDLSQTEATRSVVEGMVDGLNDHTIDGIAAFFAKDFRWMGNAPSMVCLMAFDAIAFQCLIALLLEHLGRRKSVSPEAT